MKKKVLFIINDLRMGGAQRVISIVMRELVSSGYEVALITNHQNSTDFYTIGDKIRRFSTGLTTPSKNIAQAVGNNLKRIRIIRQVITKESPDVIFSFMTETNIVAILATTFTGMPVVVSERSDPAKDRKSPVWEMLRKITYRKAFRVTTNSKAALEYLGKFVKDDKLVYLPNPIDGCKGDGRVSKGAEPDDILLVVARLHRAKGIDVLIDAMAILKSRYKDYQVWVAGDGPEKNNLQKQAKELAVDQNIRWLGETNELIPIYQAASLFILPSRREGMPNALLEAMSCGLPVIVSNASPGPLEYVVNGESGLVFDSGSSNGLADAIETLMSDRNKRQSMGNDSFEKVRPFLCPNVIPQWESVIFHNQATDNSSFAS